MISKRATAIASVLAWRSLPHRSPRRSRPTASRRNGHGGGYRGGHGGGRYGYGFNPVLGLATALVGAAVAIVTAPIAIVAAVPTRPTRAGPGYAPGPAAYNAPPVAEGYSALRPPRLLRPAGARSGLLRSTRGNLLQSARHTLLRTARRSALRPGAGPRLYGPPGRGYSRPPGGNYAYYNGNPPRTDGSPPGQYDNRR